MVDSECWYTEFQGLAVAQLVENVVRSLLFSYFLHNFTSYFTKLHELAACMVISL